MGLSGDGKRNNLSGWPHKNNEDQIWPKIKNNVRTIQAGNGIWNHKCKVTFTFLNKILLSNVEILLMLRSIEFP